MDIAVALALVGIALSLASLLWQVVSWRASGARLHVRYLWALTEDVYREPIWLLGISVTNKGRASTEVRGVATGLPDGKQVPIVRDALGQVSFPYVLEPGRQVDAYYEETAFKKALKRLGYGPGTRITPRALCGHGDAKGKRTRIGE